MDPAERGGVEWGSEFCPVKGSNQDHRLTDLDWTGFFQMNPFHTLPAGGGKSRGPSGRGLNKSNISDFSHGSYLIIRKLSFNRQASFFRTCLC